MKVETFEFNENQELPAWTKCLENAEPVKLPLLIDELVKHKIFKSKSEARNMIKSSGVSIFSTFDGLRNINDELMESFNDKRAIVTDADARWTFIDGDVIKIGKRRFIKIVEKT